MDPPEANNTREPLGEITNTNTQGRDSEQRQENGTQDAKRLRNKQYFASMSNEKRNERNMKKRERRFEKKLRQGVVDDGLVDGEGNLNVGIQLGTGPSVLDDGLVNGEGNLNEGIDGEGNLNVRIQLGTGPSVVDDGLIAAEGNLNGGIQLPHSARYRTISSRRWIGQCGV